MPIEFNEFSHPCGRCRKGHVRFKLSTSGPFALADGLNPSICSACGAKHSVHIKAVEGTQATITTTLLPD